MPALPDSALTDYLRGSYLVLLYLDHEVELEVGKLGCFAFPRGYYVYAGSAQGPGGIRARVGRHLRQRKVKRWHLDYLTPAAEIVHLRIAVGPAVLECEWSARLCGSPGGEVVAAGFGSSDCLCRSHLVHFVHRPPLDGFGTETPIPGPVPGTTP